MTFFFKQKTAYEIMPSLVGSEMCIRDRIRTIRVIIIQKIRNVFVTETTEKQPAGLSMALQSGNAVLRTARISLARRSQYPT